MDWMVATGAVCLGILIGILVGFYVQEEIKWDRRALVGAISAFAGGGVMALIHSLVSNGAPREFWLYPVGLLGGFIVGTIWEYLDPGTNEPN
jgi:hypothetical protein